MAEPEVAGSDDLLRSFYFLYDKSEKFRELFTDPKWTKKNIKKIEMVWREGPRSPHEPRAFVAKSGLVGDDGDRIWRMEFNRNLMGRINESDADNPAAGYKRDMTLEETIAHELAHAHFLPRSYGGFFSNLGEREAAVIGVVNEIRRDLGLRERRIRDPKDLRHHYKRAKHYNEEWIDSLYTKEENIRRTTGWRAHPFLAPENYRTGPLNDQRSSHDKQPLKPGANLETADRQVPQVTGDTDSRRIPSPTMHRLLSGDLSALDPQNGPFSPNLLIMLMGGKVPRFKGAARLENIAKPPAGRIGR